MVFRLKHKYRAVWYWLLAYWLIGILIILISVSFRIIFELPTARQLNRPLVETPAFVAALPFHPFFNLLVWFFFCRQYLKKIQSEAPLFLKHETLHLALTWTLLSVVIDVLFWVIIPSPLQLTAHQISGAYGQWIGLTYPAIFLATYLSGMHFIRQYKTAPEPL